MLKELEAQVESKRLAKVPVKEFLHFRLWFSASVFASTTKLKINETSRVAFYIHE